MIISQTDGGPVLGSLLQWATLLGVLMGIAAVVWRSGRVTRDIEHTSDQLDRLRLIVEELARAQTGAAISCAGNFARIESDMRAILHRIDRLEAAESGDDENRTHHASRR